MSNPMSALDSLSVDDKEIVMKKINEMQVEESLVTYNNLVENCFNECITSFRSKPLDPNESECVKRCVTKFMSYSQRVGQRFAEKNSTMAPM